MTSYTLFWRGVLLFCIGAMTGGGLLSVVLLWRGHARPFIRNLGLLLLLIYLILAFFFVHAELSGAISHFQDWLWNLDLEYTLGTHLAAVQFFAIGAAALVIALRLPVALLERLYWLVVAVGFVFLGLDEYFQIHETLIGVDRWRLLYALAGAVLGLVTLWMWRRTRAHRAYFIFITGLFITALAGILVEHAVFESFCYETPDSLVPVCEDFDVYLIFEEWFELFGTGVVLLVLLYMGQTRLTDRGWHLQKRALLLVVPLSGLLLVSYLWLLPGLEAGAAQAVNIDYGDLELVAYELGSASLAPGDSLGITLYWRAKDWIEAGRHLSLHALAEPARSDSFAQVDDLLLGQYPSTAFIPGVTVRKQLSLHIDEDVPAQQSYALVLRVWEGNYQRGNLRGIAVQESDRPLLSEDTLRLDGVTLIAPSYEPALPSGDLYQFGEVIALQNYSLPDEAQAGQTLDLSFRWQALAPVPLDLIQFVHLVKPDTGDMPFSHDQPPFAGRMPTSLWPLRIPVQDDWRLSLPPEVPAGDYALYTGLYDLQTLTRLPVVDAAGEIQPNGLLVLGTLRVEAE